MLEKTSLLLLDDRTLSDSRLDDFTSRLGPAEVARLQRFVRQERRRQFVIGRFLAREALGRLLGVAGKDLEFEAAAGRKPVVRGFEGAADFSISHSGPWVACAASVEARVGLDIERIDSQRNVLALAEQAFGDDGVRWLQARPDATRIRDFYEKWCAAEARIKLGADGEYVHYEHDELAIVLCSTGPVRPPLVLF